jgi:hypothetical protein
MPAHASMDLSESDVVAMTLAALASVVTAGISSGDSRKRYSNYDPSQVHVHG